MSRLGEKTLKAVNRIFIKRVHPLNLQNDHKTTYAKWQYEKGADTISYYVKFASAKEMFLGKRVLDLGCGAGGKSLYYASLGAKKVVGVDVVSEYESESAVLAEELGLSDKFRFVLGDAARLPFADGEFDTIIMNDFMEHVSDPEAALTEAVRVLAKGGRIYLNFPPYDHPFGAHLHDAINVPWVHLFFSEQTMINVYRDLVLPLPDGERRLAFRFSRDENGREYISYINKMSIKRFHGILSKLGISPVYYHVTPLRPFVLLLSHMPFFREKFTKMITVVIEK